MKLHSADSEGINEINVTPFVDVMMVLLIIFMISTPALVYRGLKIALPTASTAQKVSRVTLRIYLTKEGALYLDRKPVTVSELPRIVAELRAAHRPTDVLLGADKEATHGAVMGISDALRGMGIDAIAFSAVPGPSVAR